MTKSNVLWAATLCALLGGLAIDRFLTGRHLRELEHKYKVLAAAAANRTNDGNAGRGRLASGSEPPSMDAVVAHVETVFSQQSKDGTWSQSAENELNAKLLPCAVDGSRVQQLECRTTLCKVRIEHQSEQGFRDFMKRAFAQPSWHGAMVSRVEPQAPNGAVANVMFFSKEGHDMPSLED